MSEVKLLPLPVREVIDVHEPTGIKAYGYTYHSMEAYARANMEPLLAEIERLRVEVAKRDGIDPWAVLLRAQEAEARAEQLAEALRSLLESVDDLTSYTTEDDEIGHRPCCNVLSYKEHTDDCAITQARAALEQEGGND